jgi:putative membrane protein
MKNVVLSLLVTCFVISGCAFFQRTVPPLALSDADLLGILITIDKNEIDAAELANDKSTSSQVQAFADRVRKEHRDLFETHRRVAQQIGVPSAPPSLAMRFDQNHLDAMEALRAKAGSDFDRTYIKQEIAKHLQFIELVERAEKYKNVQPLKQHLVQTRLDLIGHLFAAMGLEQKLVAGQ